MWSGVVQFGDLSDQMNANVNVLYAILAMDSVY